MPNYGQKGSLIMKKSLHTKTIYRANLATALDIARKTGYEAVEIVASNLKAYMEQGHTAQDLKNLLDEYNLVPVCINDICHVEQEGEEARKIMIEETLYYSAIAKDIGCKFIQLVPLCALEGRPWEEIISITGDNIRAMAEVSEKFGVSLQLEPVGWSPINSLAKAKELIEYVGKPNFGTVIDFWHLWAAGGTTPEDVAKLDKNMICNIHFCDGLTQALGTEWDETILRGVYPGEGNIPLKEWVAAVKATGYDGYWSCELISSKHWEENVYVVAEKMSQYMDEYIGK